MKHISKNMEIHDVQVGWSPATGSLLLGEGRPPFAVALSAVGPVSCVRSHGRNFVCCLAAFNLHRLICLNQP